MTHSQNAWHHVFVGAPQRREAVKSDVSKSKMEHYRNPGDLSSFFGGCNRQVFARSLLRNSGLKADIEITAISATKDFMEKSTKLTIRIAAALIDDDAGSLLLVRKAGTQWFMQAGGKIEQGESAMSALRRELREEIGLAFTDDHARYLGTFSAPAANEPDHIVEAEVFHIRVSHDPIIRLEIEEAVWVSRSEAELMPLASLTRDHILPLSLALCT